MLLHSSDSTHVNTCLHTIDQNGSSEFAFHNSEFYTMLRWYSTCFHIYRLSGDEKNKMKGKQIDQKTRKENEIIEVQVEGEKKPLQCYSHKDRQSNKKNGSMIDIETQT